MGGRFLSRTLSALLLAAGWLAQVTEHRAQIHTELGAAYLARGQLGVALEELNEAVRADPRYAPAHNVLGLIYMELREDGKAEKSFRRALELEPGNSDAHNNYGLFLCQRGRVDESIDHFLAAVKNPLYATPEKPLVNAGLCSLKKDDRRGAEDFFQKVLRLKPQQPQALYSLAEMYYRSGDAGLAKNYMERLLKAADPSPASLWLALRIERRLGNRDAEANYGLQLRKLFPDARETQALRNGQYD
jgi:type IV pilus assembly protein PilF